MTDAAAHMPGKDAGGHWRSKLDQIARPGRGARYRMRATAGDAALPKPTSFAELAAIPCWLNWPADQQTSLAIVAAILLHADAIERELSGEKLRSLAMEAGGDLFDYVAEHCFDAVSLLRPAQDFAVQLPRPEDLEPRGRQILLRSLPLALQARYPGASNDPNSRQIAELACAAIAGFQQHTAAVTATQEPEA